MEHVDSDELIDRELAGIDQETLEVNSQFESEAHVDQVCRHSYLSSNKSVSLIKSPQRMQSVDDYVAKIASHHLHKMPVSIVDSIRDSDNCQFHSNLFTLLDEQILENILRHNT